MSNLFGMDRATFIGSCMLLLIPIIVVYETLWPLAEKFLIRAENIIAYHSDLFEALPNDLKFASIVTNPPIRAGKQVVFAIYDGSYERLVSGGELWVVIQKKQGAPSSKTHLEELFGNCEIINKDKGYYILKSVKK